MTKRTRLVVLISVLAVLAGLYILFVGASEARYVPDPATDVLIPRSHP